MMHGFEYGNTRLRGMKARLFSRQEMEGLAGANDIQNLINVLVDSPYRQAVESALVRTRGREAVLAALHQNMINTLGKIKDFFSGRILELVNLALRKYDIDNLKTILRGAETGVPGEEINRHLLPVGQLSPPILDELAQASSPREVIDRMATMRLPLARPLLDLRAERPGAGVFQMEVALEQWHDREVRSRLEKAPREFEYLAEDFDMEADIINMLTALRFAYSADERDRLEQVIGTEDVRRLLVGPGKISLNDLTTASQQDGVEEAVDVLAKHPYEEALRRGLVQFERTGRLSEIEASLRRFQLSWRSKLALRDPLGIGVLLSYLALKINEVQNIRRVVLGLDIGLDPEAIRESLVFAA